MDLYVMNADGSAPTQLTSSSVGDDLEPDRGPLQIGPPTNKDQCQNGGWQWSPAVSGRGHGVS